MHWGDAGMLEKGDVFWNRSVVNKLLIPILSRLILTQTRDLGNPDIIVEDEASMVTYGLDAIVYNISWSFTWVDIPNHPSR